MGQRLLKGHIDYSWDSYSLRRREKSESGFAVRVLGSSNSSTLPCEMTMVRSLCIMVRGCRVIVSKVQFPSSSWLTRLCIFCSATASMLAEGSSRMTTLDLRRITRQMQSSCFSPRVRLDAPPGYPTSISRPFGSLWRRSSSWATLSNSMIWSSSILPSGSRLKRRVPVNMVGS